MCVSASIKWCRTQNNILSKSMLVVFTLVSALFLLCQTKERRYIKKESQGQSQQTAKSVGKMDLLMAGGAAEVLLVVSPICSLPLRSTHPPPLLAVCCLSVLAKMGSTSTASGQLEANLFRLRIGVEIFEFEGIT